MCEKEYNNNQKESILFASINLFILFNKLSRLPLVYYAKLVILGLFRKINRSVSLEMQRD